ncbi:MAG TPA: DUF1223 domain-containing protein [Puia sp.]|jgi:hypothetical protein|nr:DUF1223 domain-containing protein [Puia sp.]
MLPIKRLVIAGSWIAAVLVAAAFTARSAYGVARPQTKSNAPVPADPGFAVVELFTSEGCSSCPPADDLAARIQKEDKDRPVFLLAFHVDYWDRLGWKDVFSSAAYSDRQRQYARWLRLQSVYTPQIVVNGKKEFVGSEASTLHSAIESNLKLYNNDLKLSISNVKKEGEKLDWSWQTQGNNKGLSLVVALVQYSATTNVRSGENGGHTLSHVQIVRKLQSIPLNAKSNGSGQMDWSASIKPGEAEVIAFLQNEDNGEIVAATRSNVQ